MDYSVLNVGMIAILPFLAFAINAFIVRKFENIAVMINGEVVAGRQHLAMYGHASGIIPLSVETIEDAGTTFDAMTHVAVGCGPGSFTGIRVA